MVKYLNTKQQEEYIESMNDNPVIPVPNIEQHLSNVFFRCLESRLIAGRIIPIKSCWSVCLKYYIDDCNREVYENKFCYFFRSIDAIDVLAHFNENADIRRNVEVQLFCLDNRIEIEDYFDKLDCDVVRHIDNIGFYELIIKDVDKIRQVLTDIDDTVRNIDKSIENVPAHLFRRVLERRGNFDGMYDWCKRLSLLSENETFLAQIAIPNLVMKEDFYQSIYSLLDVQFRKRISNQLGVTNKKCVLKCNMSIYDTIYRINVDVSLVESTIGYLLAKGQTSIKWMDYACGVGTMIQMVNPEKIGCTDYNFVGVDTELSKIELANTYTHREKVEFVVGSDVNDFDVEKYDIVSMCQFVEHLYDPLKFFKELKMKKGACLIISVPLREDIHEIIPGEHIWTFDENDILRILELSGYKVILRNSLVAKYNVTSLDYFNVVAEKIDI